jgi:hypothetical protein
MGLSEAPEQFGRRFHPHGQKRLITTPSARCPRAAFVIGRRRSLAPMLDLLFDDAIGENVKRTDLSPVEMGHEVWDH